jgi:hypothetical protein
MKRNPLGRSMAEVDSATTSMCPPFDVEITPGKTEVWRTSTHPVRSRIESQGVIRCHSVFRIGESMSPTQNPAYAPSSAHLLYP